MQRIISAVLHSRRNNGGNSREESGNEKIISLYSHLVLRRVEGLESSDADEYVSDEEILQQ